MSADFRIKSNFFDHPKTVRLIRRLGLDGVISLQRLWGFACESRSTGELTGMDSEYIEIAARWNGEVGLFTRTLIDVGFLDEGQDGYSLHDWEEHNPWAAQFDARSKAGKRAAEARWGSKNASRNAELCDSQCASHASALPTHTTGNADALPAQCPQPNPTQPNPEKKEESPDGDLSPTVSDDALQSQESPPPQELEEPAEQEAPASQPEQHEDAGEKQGKLQPPDCPHAAIIGLYHELLPELPLAESLTAIRKSLRTRWREDKKRRCLDWWRAYFARVAASDFLCGRVKDFSANLLWLIGPKNMGKVLNGQYDNRAAPIRDGPRPLSIRDEQAVNKRDSAILALQLMGDFNADSESDSQGNSRSLGALPGPEEPGGAPGHCAGVVG